MTAPTTVQDRPRVLVNFASSVDGKINPAPGLRQGKFMMSRHREDFRRMLALRAQADAILIGASNLRADNPDLAIPADERAARRARGAPEPARIVVTGTGDGITPDLRMFDPARGGPSIVAPRGRRCRPRRARAWRRSPSWPSSARTSGDARPAGLARRPRRADVALRRGRRPCAQLFAARAVDELYLTLVPRLLGGARAPTIVGGAGFGPDEIPDPTLTSLERIGDELFLRYDFSWT